ncbi:MAG: class I SAM-dependent RNA methyltransferase [Chloroflexi bacterium]|nr:class I SAM-dependent RNA methyltransferase [Chloroflexota bacterium]
MTNESENGPEAVYDGDDNDIGDLDAIEPDVIELELDEMVHGGNALGRHAGRAIFVPYTIPGERILARITDDRNRYAFAQGVTLLEASGVRVYPRCSHFGPGRCGGCHFQHIDYAVQPEFKRDVVVDQMVRIGGFDDPPVLPMLPSPDPWAYRVHATFHVDDDGALCFVGTDNETLIPIDECHIIRPELLDLLDELNFEDIPGVTRVRVQVGSDGGLMVILSTDDDLAPELLVDVSASVNLLLSDNEPVNLIGDSHTYYTVHGRKFQVTAGGFFQVNLPQAEALVDLVLDRLNLRGDESVLDLYAGVGLFTAFLAERAALVTAIESYPPAVTDADENLADFDNVDLIEGSVEDVLPQLAEAYDAVVLDPPRSGLHVDALDALAEIGPATLVYVSCDPATLARDAKRLVTGKGYRLVEVQPVDMFPQTFHIECVAHFAR